MKTEKMALNGPKGKGVTAKLESSLNQIASLSKTLNETSDQLSKSIAEVESALNRYALGIWAWIDEPLAEEEVQGHTDSAADVFHQVQRLGYGKHRGTWGLLVASGIEEFWPDNVKTTFLREAPREIRLQAIAKFPQLLQDLAKRLAETTEEASKKALEAEGIAEALRQKRG